MVKLKATYKVPFRRRRECKTNYRLRRRLILSRKTLLVVRKSSRNFLVQFIKPQVGGDVTLTHASSIELKKRFEWKMGTKSTPSAYLVGYLAGLKALKAGVQEAILYMGLHRPVKGSTIFAALKGVLDAGVNVPHSEDKLPSEGRVRGEHVANYAKRLLNEAPDLYRIRFSMYLKRGLTPENIIRHFEEVKKRLMKEVSPKLKG